LQKFFAREKAHFDGGERRVAHILWKLPADADEASHTKLRDQAAEVRAEIVAGKTTFAAAAAKHSQAPTAAQGGDIGWIRRAEPMPEAFSRQAFQLAVDEISPPVASPFGWHLIQCLEIKPGQRTWQDARDELRIAVAQYLFAFHAQQERQRTQPKIERFDLPPEMP
jgi:parvulin-like peptidyl-prolyl isomerase